MKKSLYPRKVFFLLGIVMSVVNIMSAHSQTAMNAIAYSQQKHNSPTNAESKTISQLLLEARKVFDVDFVYESKILPDAALTMNVAKYKTVTAFLDELLKPYGLRYKKVLKKAYVIYSNDEELKALMLSLNIRNNEEVVQVKVPQDTSVNVTGKITSQAKGEPLDGVSIYVKGTAKGAVTDKDGLFKLAVPGPGTVLVVSMVGYTSQEMMVGTNRNFNVSLVAQNSTMEEVVVVGYGQQKKESVTASITTMSSKELVQSPVTNISNAMVGRLSGLTAVQTSGKPGADASTLYVRGVGTYMGGTSPLILVDGIARDTYNDIDPNEIETINILKDASATAVFGVRGANGVILITTKRGKSGTPRISATAQTAVSEFAKMPNFVNSFQYATLQDEKAFETYWINHAKDADVKTWDDFTKKREDNWQKEATLYYSPEDLKYFENAHTPTLADGSQNPYYDPYFHPDVDWKKQMFKRYAPQTQANVNINGGGNYVKYFLSLGYLSQQGMMQTNYMPFSDEMQYRKKRYNLRGNFDFDVNKDFKVSVDIGTQFFQIYGIDGDQYMWEKRILWSSPLSSPGMINGKFVVPFTNQNTALNPMYEMVNYNNYNITDNSTLNSSVKLSYKLDFVTPGLSVNARGAYDSYFSNRTWGKSYPLLYGYRENPNGDKLNPILVQLNDPQPSSRASNVYIGKWRKMYGEFSLNYGRTFGDHAITALALFNLEKKYDPDLKPDLPHAYLGWVGRVTYAYKSKYLAEYNIGINGSENFPEGQRFGTFPAYSLGWIASRENFFPVNTTFTYLKFRGSIGKVGNDNIILPGQTQAARYLYLPDTWVYTGGYNFGTVNNRTFIQGAAENTIGNPNVSWEKATKSNVGFEAKFFKDKLTVTYDHFYEHRTDILSYKGTVPAIVAADLPPYNLGEVTNQGNEVEIGYNGSTRKFTYWVKGNLSNTKNKIIFKDESVVPGLEYQAATGKPINQGLYLQSEGLYTTWGDLYKTDNSGNPILSEPLEAKGKDGKPYTNAAGNTVYQKDLGYAGVPLQPGEVRLKDVNFDGVIDDKDYVRSGKTDIPEITYGLSFGFSYKGFDFSVLFQGAAGVAKNAMAGQLHFNKQESLFEVDWNRFTQERYAAGQQIDFPIAAYNQQGATNTFFLINTSYTRLKNMEIGYTLQPKFLKTAGINSARIYVNGYNLHTWTAKPIWGDPENLGYIGYPLTRTYNAGINVNF